ncbi:TPA: type I toxin-antitoxin system Ibs family toxin [Escherichia coli]
MMTLLIIVVLLVISFPAY